MELKTLTLEEVKEIHHILAADFAEEDDPISPVGVRDLALLDSAVYRQHTGFDGVLKYPYAIPNAATLLYGICNDHPFYNGNKRTALVAMLVHLDKNKITLFDTNQKDLYKFMLSVASHTVGIKIDKRKKNQIIPSRSSDEQVEAIISWLYSRSGKVTRGEKNITYNELGKILGGFGFTLENPKNNSIDIVVYEEKETGFIKKRTIQNRTRIGNIPWPGERREVALKTIKHVRAICNLREEDGVDSDAFYNYYAVVNSYVNKYRKVLRKLAKT